MRQLLQPTTSRRWSGVFLAIVTAVTVGCLGGALLLLDSVFWRPLPGIPKAHELTVVTWQDETLTPVSVPLSALPALEATAATGVWCPFNTGSMSRVAIDGVTRLRPTSSWMPACEAVFQVRPRVGRFWSDGPDAHRSAVISERLWDEAFGRSEAALGKTIHIDDLPFTIIGVAPRSFMGINVEIAPEIFTVLTFRTGHLTANGRPVIFRQLISRVDVSAPETLGTALKTRLDADLAADGMGLTAAQRTAITKARIDVDTTGRGQSYLRAQYSDEVRAVGFIGSLLFVMALVVVAGVVSVLVSLRAREFAIRESLGATRIRNTRLLLRELAVPIGVGLVVAAPVSLGLARVLSLLAWSSQAANTLVPGFRPTTIGVFVLMAAGVLVAGACAAVWRLAGDKHSRPSLGRVWAHRAGSGWMGAAQAAVAVGVLSATTLVVHGVWAITQIDLGHTRSGLVFGRLLALRPGPIADPHSHYTALTSRLTETPGIAGVALAAGFPNRVRTGVRLEPGAEPAQTTYDVVSDNFFDVTGIAVLAGRRFVPADQAGGPVAIVSADFATRHFGTTDVIGRRLWITDPDVAHEIVGVVKATRAVGRGPDDPVVYRSRRQQPLANPMILVSVSGDTGAAIDAVNRAVQAPGRDYIVGLGSIEADMALDLAPERTLRAVALAVSVLVLVLATVGLFCQHTIWASADWRFTVVRVALGESRRAVVTRALHRYAGVVGVGALAGLPLAVLASAAVDRTLPGMNQGSSWLLALVACGVVLLGLVVAAAPIRALAGVSAADVQRLE